MNDPRRPAQTAAATVLLFALLFMGRGLSAQTENRQRIYPAGSGVWTALRSLYIAKGMALPSTTGPWSGDELLLMLDRLDTSSLGPGETELYDLLSEELLPPGGPVLLSAVPDIETRVHANGKDFFLPEQFFRPVNTMEPLLGLEAELFLTPHSYLYFEWPVTARIHYAGNGEADKHPLSAHGGERVFSANVPFLAGSRDLDADIPYRALFSLGGRGWYAVIGRDRLSWGPGESGNFVIGDHVHYHNNLRASFYNPRFKYTYNVSSFVYPGEYYLGWDSSSGDYNTVQNWSGVQTKGAEIRGLHLFIAHRGEGRFFGGRLNVVLTESILYQSRNGTIGIEQFIPSVLLHNLYRDDNQNSLLAIEADYALARGMNLYGQFVLDQLALPFAEKGATGDSPGSPNAVGLMLGVKAAFPLGDGFFYGSLEGAWTSPYLYLQSESGGFNSNGFAVANRYYTGGEYYFFVEEFLGYRWGGDAVVFNANASYARQDRWKARFNLMVMIHGTHDKWTKWTEVYAAGSGRSPEDGFLTESHAPSNYADDAGARRRNALSVTLVPSLSGSFRPIKDLELYGEADFIAAFNHRNIKDNFAADIQLTLGIRYAFRFPPLAAPGGTE